MNMSQHVVKALGELFSKCHEPAEFRHLREYGIIDNADDSDWMPFVAENGFILITCDRAKRCGGTKLPDCCVQHKVTHVMMMGRLSEESSLPKVCALLSVWRKLAAVRLAP